MKGHQRQRRLIITDTITFGINAIIRVRNGNDYDEIDITELAVLDGITATTAELNIMDGVTATAAEINANCDVLNEAVTATNVITAAETGTHFFLNTATAFVSTLPVVAAGLEYWFHIGATEPTTSHTVVTNASANVIVGNIATTEDALGSVATVTDADTISFIANKAVHGDFAHVWSDGTDWYLDGMCKVQDGMTTTSGRITYTRTTCRRPSTSASSPCVA